MLCDQRKGNFLVIHVFVSWNKENNYLLIYAILSTINTQNIPY